MSLAHSPSRAPRSRGVVAASVAGLSCAHHDAAPLPIYSPASESGIGVSNSARVPASGGNPLALPYQVGLATWYGQAFAGKKTSNGERFDPSAMTAAHRKLPFNSWVEVCRVETGTCVRVRINDRGPWGNDRRIIDLSLQGRARSARLRRGGLGAACEIRGRRTGR